MPTSQKTIFSASFVERASRYGLHWNIPLMQRPVMSPSAFALMATQRRLRVHALLGSKRFHGERDPLRTAQHQRLSPEEPKLRCPNSFLRYFIRLVFLPHGIEIQVARVGHSKRIARGWCWQKGRALLFLRMSNKLAVEKQNFMLEYLDQPAPLKVRI